MSGVKLSRSAHVAHGWEIDQIVPDFRLLDVWALPVHGDRDEFDSFLEMMASFDPAGSDSVVTRLLFQIRFRLGSLLGWDQVAERPIPDCEETSLSARLPSHLRDDAARPTLAGPMNGAEGGFVPLYRTKDEWAAEISNGTVHGVMHLAWAERGTGGYRAQLAVYVKPRGMLGRMYLRLIGPFRHLIVYPALMRQIERAWAARR